MAIKDLFNQRSSNVVVSSSALILGEDVESLGYISAFVEDEQRVEPHVNFTKPENFAKYGSAEQYYDQSIKWIYGEYPYDGSLKEKYEWQNNSTLLDLYIYDNRYPKTTGYANFSSDGWGTLTASMVIGYGAPATTNYEYINFKGGPNSEFGSSLGTSSLKDVFDSKSNIWDSTVTGAAGPITATRESNLKTDLAEGVTVEFWLKTGSLSNALTEKQVVFDLWNGQGSSSADYGRLRIEIDPLLSASSPFRVTVLSGAVGLSTSSLEIGSSLDLNSFSDWNHYAFSFVNNGDNITTKLYVNGDLDETITTGSSIGEVRKDLQANIGALLTGTFNMRATPTGPNLGWGKLSGSMDEFRFWKTKRSSKDIGRYWFTSNLGGGTNTDNANLDLGVYYKFNEGIVDDSGIDSIVLDYSGRVTNGTWTGYPSSNARNTGSAIVSASAGVEDLDPIIYPTHADVSSLSTELLASGTLWDYENNSSLYYSMPAWIIEEDEGNGGSTGNLKKLTQIMGTYLDNLDLLIGELPKLNVASYPSSSVRGKLNKPYPYMQTAVGSLGMHAPELFSNSDLIEYFGNRNETVEFEEEIHDVKNLIYNNIYNNLPDIYKAKGTDKAFRNLIRCFGVGDDLIRLNIYSNNDTYKFETKRRQASYKTKAANFNNVDRFNSTVYQYADSTNPNSVSYISGSSTDSKTYEDSFPITLETEIIFPQKIPATEDNAGSQEFRHITASLFGMHTAIASQSMAGTETDTTWHTTDNANLQVYAIRSGTLTKNVKFMLTSSAPAHIPELTSNFFFNVYENQKWNFAVRLKPHGYPQAFASGALDNNYIVEFYGVSYIGDRKVDEFIVSGTVAKDAAETFLTSPKRIYAGAHRTNFTGAVLQRTDVKITSCRYWFDYLNNEAIQNHAMDPGNFGNPNPSRDAFFLETDLSNVEVPEIESLALSWNFESLTGSNASGQFTVQDVSSGSVAEVGRYNWLGKILKYQHTGRGDLFPANSTGSIETQYLHAARQQLPETVFGDDNIRVLSQAETEVFTKETRPYKTYYAFEKSMYQVISDEIIRYFGSIVDFNNLIGEPVNRYRPEYKSLKYLRQFFFERIGNTPDLDKFVEYYKWIDSTLEAMLMELVPASAQTSDGIDNIVESHVLERNKYQNKFPTLEFVRPDPEGATITINKLLYSWKTNHHPLTGSDKNKELNPNVGLQATNCGWWKGRAERDVTPLNSGDTGIDSDRNRVLSASLQALERNWSTVQRYVVEKTKVIHGGVNYSDNKKQHFYRGINFPHGSVTSIGIPQNVLKADQVELIPLKDCDDVGSVFGFGSIADAARSGSDGSYEVYPKRKYSYGTRIGRKTFDSGSFDGIKAEIAMPFNIMSASTAMKGYNKGIHEGFHSGTQLTNLHNDGYGQLNEVPMQGPFTEKYVGGHQARHVRLNYSSSTRVAGDRAATVNNLDGQYTRPEAYRILLGGGAGSSGSIGITGPDYGGPYPDVERYRAWFFREETAKRPVNIRNILQTTASVDTVLSGVLQHGPIGNYEKTYQVVQTSGRSTNNFWFNDNGATLPTMYISDKPKTTNVHTLVGVRINATQVERRGNTFIPGTYYEAGVSEFIMGLHKNSNLYAPQDGTIPAARRADRTVYQLPSRTKQDAVIVERFSAPGGPEISSLGFLDIMAAEKSVYNALPFRNLTVRGSGSGEPSISGTMRIVDHTGHRRGLRTLLSLHCGPFGTDGTFGKINQYTSEERLAQGDAVSASFHKTNRNARLVIKTDVNTSFDSKFQYGTGSVYDNWYVQHPIPQNDFQYSWISGSFLSGNAPFAHAPRSGFGSGSSGFFSAITFMSSSLPNYAAGVYSNGQAAPRLTPVDFVGLNTLFYEASDTDTRIFGGTEGAGGTITLQLQASASEYLNTSIAALDHTASTNGILNNRNGPFGFNSWKQVRVGNSAMARAMRKDNIVSTIDPATLSENQPGLHYYNWLPSPSTNAQIFGPPLSGPSKTTPVSNVLKSVLQYHEPNLLQKYYPFSINATLDPSFWPSSGFKKEVKVDAYAAYGNKKHHFSNSKLNNALLISDDVLTPADELFDEVTDDLKGTLNSVKYSEALYPKELNVYRPHIRKRTTFKSFWRNVRQDRTEKDETSPLASSVKNSQGIPMATQSIWPLDGRLSIDPQVTTDAFVNVAANALTRGGGEGELQNSVNTVHSPYHSEGFSCSDAGGDRDITGSATYNRRHLNITGSSAWSYSSNAANAITYRGDLVPFSGDAPWDAAAQSGKYPFYDSYSDYVHQMRLIGKDYSIIPEYRMSERMDDVIEEGIDPFNDASLFSLTGAVATARSSEQTEFYKTYSHSDFMKYFDVVQNDLYTSEWSYSAEEGIPGPTSLTVRCKALLKLLPYEGFYPAQRTLQLASLFSKSYGEYVDLTGSTPAISYNPRESRWRAFLAPMFAPGIMFNTIKSGIAVDYPVMTGGCVLDFAPSADRKNYALAEPVYFSFRVPFEALVEPENYIANHEIIDLEVHPSAAINATASWNGEGDSRYKLAMHNFLAETPDFFLENQTFTSFFSNPSSKWKSFDRSKSYKMRVKIRKSYASNWSGDPLLEMPGGPPQIVSGSETIVMYSRPSAFGPPTMGSPTGSKPEQHGAGGGSFEGYNAPFTPPYYDGSAWVDLEYNPSLHADPNPSSVNDLLTKITASYLRYENWAGDVEGLGGPQYGEYINHNAVQISSSVNLFGTTNGLKDLLKYSGVDASGEEQWVIQTKFETPILNFIGARDTATSIASLSFAAAASYCSGGAYTRPIGMWHQYGRLPEGSEGIYLGIQDFPKPILSQHNSSGSLADAVGFNKKDEKLGKVAASKTIREAVVAVPFVERTNNRKFFEIDRHKIDTILQNPTATSYTPDDSIKHMVDAMQRYVFPPSMDFINYPNEVGACFSMYIFEFEHQLNQQDLVDIWQNLPPRIGRAFDPDAPLDTDEIMQTKEVTHVLNNKELLEDVDSKLQWMVFKVKQRAQTNYWKKTVANNPDLSLPSDVANAFTELELQESAFSTGPSSLGLQEQIAKTINEPITKYAAGGAGQGGILKIDKQIVNYNWPYDFFSLVELVKLEQDVIFEQQEMAGSGGSQVPTTGEEQQEEDA
tara:strand:- start:3961 stop:13266 length:9306 start_codon:yes stop_codon:yes gene_type:complete